MDEESRTTLQPTVRLTTTLNLLHDAGACRERYGHLVRALGGRSYDHDAPINLLTILEHNGIDDCLWALRATVENCDGVARLMAADFAGAVLPIYERARPQDRRPRVAIETARRFARGEAGSDELAAASDAAWNAGWDAPWAAGRAVAKAAANAAGCHIIRAAYHIADDAARAASQEAASAVSCWSTSMAIGVDVASAFWGDSSAAIAAAAAPPASPSAWGAARAAQADIIRRYLSYGEIR